MFCHYVCSVQLYSLTCCYSERCIADIKKWCSNPEVSRIRFSGISDNKCTIYCISSSNGISKEVDIFSIWIYHFCSTCILYESIPLYIITSYVTVKYTSGYCSISFTYSDIIWLINYYTYIYNRI